MSSSLVTKLKFPMWVVLNVPFASILLVSAALIGFLGVQNGTTIASDFTNQLLAEVSAHVQQNLDAFFDTARLLNEQNVEAFRLNQIDLSDLDAMQRRFLAQIRAYPTIQAIYFGSAQREYAGAWQNVWGAKYVVGESSTESNFFSQLYEAGPLGEHGKLVMSTKNHEFRTRTWYQAAVQAGHSTWTPIFTWVDQSGISVDSVSPVYDKNGVLLGVLDVSLNPSSISAYLQRLSIEQKANVFIVDEAGLLVASSTMPQPYERSNGVLQRFDSLMSYDPFVQSATHQIVEQFGSWSRVVSSQRFEYKQSDETQLAQVFPYQRSGPQWWVVVAVPEATYLNPINDHVSQTLVLILLTLLATVILLTFVARRITQPIRQLSHASKLIAAGNWTQRVAVGHQLELGELATSFNQMSDQLQESTALLQASEARLRAIFEYSADSILVAKNGIQIIGNPAYLSLFGYKNSDEYVGKSIFDLTVESEHQRIKDFVNSRAQHESAPIAYEARGHRQDGSEFDVEVHVSTYQHDGEIYTIANGRDITERKRIEQALRDSEQRFRSTFEQATVGIAHVAPDGHFLLINDKFCDLVGYSRAEMLTKTFQEITHPDDLPTDVENLQRLFAGEINSYSHEKRYKCKDQSTQWVQLTVAMVRDENNNPKYLIGVVEDIADRKRAENENLRINRTLAVLSQVNQAIVRIRPVEALFERVCNIAVDNGGFQMAWLGLLDPETKQVNPVATSGVSKDYLTKLDIALVDTPKGYGPSASALRNGKPVVIQDIQHDPAMAPWSEDALRLGYRSSAAFPLKVEGEMRGVLNLYAPQPNFFNDQEQALLEEMAGDISFAMEFAEMEKRRKQAETRLQEAERFARSTVDALSAHIAILDEHGMIISVNAAWSRFAEKNNALADAIGVGTNYLSVLECVDPERYDGLEAKAVLKSIRQMLNGEIQSFSIEYPCHSPDEKRWFVARITRFTGDNGSIRIVVAHENITERVLVSELLAKEKYQLSERLKELNCLFSHSKLMERQGITLDTLFQETVELMPAAWQYPDITCARLMIGDRTYATTNFKETPWRQASEIIVDGDQLGWLEVYHLEERPSEFEGPFLKEERFLIDELARRLDHKIKTLRAEDALQQAHATLEQKVEKRTVQLQLAKERVEAILNNSVDGILLANQNFAIQQTNTAFDRLFKCQPDACFNQPLTSLLATEDNELTINSIQKHLAENRDFYISVRARRCDGTLFDAELGIGRISNQGFVCVIRDITERKQSQVALEKRNLTLTALHMGALEIGSELDIPVLLPRIVRRAVDLLDAHRGGCIYLYDADNNVLRLEAATGIFENRVGITHRANEGLSGHVLVSGQPFIVDDYTRWSAPSSVLLPNPPSTVMGVPLIIQGQSVGVLLVDANSQERTFATEDIRLAEMFAAQAAAALHNAELYSAAQREIAERKNTEKALADERNLLRTVIDTVPDFIYVEDTQCRLILQNTASAEALGYSNTKDLIGKTVTDVYPADLAAKFIADDHRVIETETALINIEEQSLGRDGAEIWALTTKVPFYTIDGELRGLVGITRDITVQKQAEEVLRQALAKEKELGDLKTRFVSMASHEFRTPLATILALTDTLSAYRHKLPDDQIEQRLTKIKCQVGHLKEIMEDVLLLARMQARRVEFNPAMVDIDELCRSVLDEFQSRPDIKHQLNYVSNTEASEVMLDRKLIRQVISNLISNAIKYSPESKPIQIILECSNEISVLTVRDQGIGIPEDDLKHLFEPFHRASNTGNISGTGLGLVITKEFIDLHGGTITVESQLDVGTTFTICIPAFVQGETRNDKNSSN